MQRAVNVLWLRKVSPVEVTMQGPVADLAKNAREQEENMSLEVG